MKPISPPAPAVSLAPQLYFQLVHTLTSLLPPPLDDSPDALRTRNLAAIAKVAAMRPVNANETDLAAQCIAARAQAEDVMRLIRENRHDIALTVRLNAQYMAMIRTSLSVEARLLRVQALRQKREAVEATATQDAWTQHVAEQSMLVVADPGIVGPRAARGEAPRSAPRVPEAAPSEVPVAAPALHANQTIAKNVSEYDPNSHDVAFETWMSEHLGNQGPDETGLRKRVLDAMAESFSAGRALSVNGRESPGGTD